MITSTRGARRKRRVQKEEMLGRKNYKKEAN